MVEMGSESVKVVVRCRPLNDREMTMGCKVVVSVDPSRCQCFIEKPGAKEDPAKQFTFDGVYFIQHTTEQIYNEIAYPLVEGVTEGYNGTIFAYGQTGSGKSFTMQGLSDHPVQRGIIPRAFEHIFETIQCAESTKFLVRASYLEIYNEEIRDLLGSDTKQKLELKEHAERGVYVRGLTLLTVCSVEQCERLMAQGWRNRSVGYTLMNKDSSRSHSIFTIHIEICSRGESGQDALRAGKLNLVDLAGSERQSKTGATGERLREATKINLSLSALGNVISALVDGRCHHVPYRDSKLTRLLQDSLGGNTRTLMVACLSPADNNYEESLSTLRYAHRAKSILNQPRLNQDPKDALLREYREEIQQLRALLSSQLGDASISSLHASQVPEVSQVPTPNTTVGSEAEKEMLKQEYEEKLARLQMDYNAEQESKAKLEQDMEALRYAYECRLSDLRSRPGTSVLGFHAEESSSSVGPTGEECQPGSADPPEVTGVDSAVVKVTQPQEPKATSAPLDTKQALERLQKLEKVFVGGEQAQNEHLRQWRRQRKSLAEQRRKQLKEALVENKDDEDGDNVMLRVYDSLQEEVHARGRLLDATRSKLKAARIEIQDLQCEFEQERDDYLTTIRRMQREGQLLQAILERTVPLVRRDCNYSSVERLRAEAVWDDDNNTWKLPEVVVEKTTLPTVTQSAVNSQELLLARRNLSAAQMETSAEDDRYRVLLHRSNSATLASSYFKCKRTDELLASKPARSLETHTSASPEENISLVSQENLQPRPFRLESLAVNGKAKRRKSRTHLSEGN